MSRLHATPTTALRLQLRVLRRRPFAGLFADRIAAIEVELLRRDLPEVARESGGYLSEWIVGVQ